MAEEAVGQLCQLLALGQLPELPPLHDTPWPSFLASVVEAVTTLVGRNGEMERLASESHLQQVNLKQMLKNLQHKKTEDQAEINRLKTLLEESSVRITELETEASKEVGDKSLVQVDLEKASSQVELLRARCERLEAEKGDLMRLVERRQLDVDSLNQQMEDVTARMRAIREESLKHDSELSEARVKLTSAQRQLDLTKEEVEKYRQQAEWSSQELEQHIQEFSNYRKQKSAEAAALQVQAEGLQETKSQLEEQNRIFRSNLEEKDSKVEELLRRTRDAESTLAEQESMFIQEMNARSRLADLYKEGMEETTARLEETEALLRVSQASSGNIEDRVRQGLLEKEREMALLQTQLEGKESEVVMLRKHLDEFGRIDSASATPGGGKTLSEVYAEYAKTKTELLKANQEIDRLKGCIQDICQDIEARVPVLQMERRENERLKVDVSALSQQLLEVSKSRDELDRRLRRSLEEFHQADKEKSLLEQQVKDLGKQIQALLGQMEGIVPNDSEVMDSEQVIDERLVVFRNIQELQIRNQELVKVLRELSQQQETAEIERLRKVEQEMRDALDHNASELAELREIRQRQSTLMESLIRQRDMLREMLSNNQANTLVDHQGGGVETSAAAQMAVEPVASELKAEFDLFKQEKAESEKYLMEQLEQCRIEKSEFNGRVAQLTAQLEFNQERYTLLKQNYDMERTELDSLRKSNSTALSSIMQHQSQVQQFMGEMLSAKDSQQRLSSQLSSIRVELEMTRTNERRLTNELAVFQQEKERLAQLLSGLQAMTVEHEGSEGALKQRLNEQIEFLERELQSARHKVVEEVESHKLAVAVADREYRDLMETHNKIKEEANQAKANAAESTRKAHDLEVLYSRSEERLAQLMIPTGQSEADLPRELAAIRVKLGAVEDELGLEREHITMYKTMAKTAEDNLNDLNRTFDNYKASSEHRLLELSNQVESLSSKLESVEERRQYFEGELAKAVNSFGVEKNQLLQQLTELKEYESMAKSHSSLRKEDVDRLQQLVEESRSKYEQEVVAHGRDLEALVSLKAEVGGYQHQISELALALNSSKDQVSLLEKMLQGEREQWNAERVDIQRRVSELESQNNILLGQIETMAGRSSRRVSDVPTVEGEAMAADHNDLVEVVRYLRRQKDILQIEHDSMSMEYRRVKSQAEQLQKSLDETRSVLAEERQGSQWQEKMAVEYRALLEKVSQMNILRESNVTLRQEADSFSLQVRALQEQLQKAQDAVVPKEEECRILTAKIAASEEEILILKDDRDNWKRRFDQLLVKYRVDPAEMEQQNEQLKTQLEQMKGELDQLRSQLEKTIDESAGLKELEGKLEEKTAELEQISAKYDKLDAKQKGLLQASRQIQKQRDELSVRVAELSSATPAADSEQLVALQAEKNRLEAEKGHFESEIAGIRVELADKVEKLEKYNEAFRKLSKMKDQFRDAKEQIKSLNEQLTTSELKLEEVKKENELRNNLLNSSWKTRMQKLNLELDRLRGADVTAEETSGSVEEAGGSREEASGSMEKTNGSKEETGGSMEEAGGSMEEIGGTLAKKPKIDPVPTAGELDDFLAEPRQDNSDPMLGYSDLEDETMVGASEEEAEEETEEGIDEEAEEEAEEETATGPTLDEEAFTEPISGSTAGVATVPATKPSIVPATKPPIVSATKPPTEQPAKPSTEQPVKPSTEQSAQPTEEPKSRVIDLSSIAKRSAIRQVPIPPAQRGNIRGRGQSSLRRMRRGGPGGGNPTHPKDS